MEYIFKSESSLKRIEAIRKFLLGDIWLIILAVVLVITAVVLTIVIVRKRKHKEYSVHEKI